MAADTDNGAQASRQTVRLDTTVCGNVFNGQRTIYQDDLRACLTSYNDGQESAIAAQVTNGKNVMLAFGASLSADDISDVAAMWNSSPSRVGP